mgnify:FL=1
MRQTTIWDFLPQESSNEAKQTNQRNIMLFKSLDDVIAFIKQQESKGSTGEPVTDGSMELPHSTDECLDCKLAQLSQEETILLAEVNVNILTVINNTLNQDAPIRNEQADTLVKLAQVKSILGSC